MSSPRAACSRVIRPSDWRGSASGPPARLWRPRPISARRERPQAASLLAERALKTVLSSTETTTSVRSSARPRLPLRRPQLDLQRPQGRPARPRTISSRPAPGSRERLSRRSAPTWMRLGCGLQRRPDSPSAADRHARHATRPQGRSSSVESRRVPPLQLDRGPASGDLDAPRPIVRSTSASRAACRSEPTPRSIGRGRLGNSLARAHGHHPIARPGHSAVSLALYRAAQVTRQLHENRQRVPAPGERDRE